MMTRKHSDARGFTLLEMALVLAITAIVLVAAQKFITDLSKVDKVFTTESELEGIRRLMRSKFDCKSSINPRPAACDDVAEAQLMELKTSKGATLIAVDPLAASNWVGKYHLRARCVRFPIGAPIHRAVWIEYRPETAAGSNAPSLNPKTRQPYAWTPLFKTPRCTLSF